jgi:transposase
MESADTYTEKYVDCPQCGVKHYLDDEDEWDQKEYTCPECNTTFIVVD